MFKLSLIKRDIYSETVVFSSLGEAAYFINQLPADQGLSGGHFHPSVRTGELGHRSKTHFREATALWVDIDGTIPVSGEAEALAWLTTKLSQYKHIIKTSRNHMRPKDGKEAVPRFHACLFFASPVTGSVYEATCKYLEQQLSVSGTTILDTSCSEYARQVYCGGKVVAVQEHGDFLPPIAPLPTAPLHSAHAPEGRLIPNGKRHEALMGLLAYGRGVMHLDERSMSSVAHALNAHAFEQPKNLEEVNRLVDWFSSKPAGHSLKTYWNLYDEGKEPGMNDPNKARSQEVRQLLNQSHEARVESYRSSAALVARSMENAVPFLGTNVLLLAGDNLVLGEYGKGKSTFVANQTHYFLKSHDGMVDILTNEERPADIANRIACLNLGVSFSEFQLSLASGTSSLTETVAREAENVLKRVRIISSAEHGLDLNCLEDVLDAIETLATGQDSKLVFIDHIHAIEHSRDPQLVEPYRIMKALGDRMKDITQRVNIPIIRMSQIRAQNGEPWYLRVPNTKQAGGSPVRVFEIVRRENQTEIVVQKARGSEDQGKALSFNFEKGKFVFQGLSTGSGQGGSGLILINGK